MVKRRILVIDDLEVFRVPLVMALNDHGYKAVPAANGYDALELIERNVQKFELLLVDFSMPGMDGLTFLGRLKEYMFMSDVPVIMLTDMADKNVVMKACQFGAKDYVLKSNFTVEDLLKKIERHLWIDKGDKNKENDKREVRQEEEAGSVELEQGPSAPKEFSPVYLKKEERLSPEQVLMAIKKFLALNPIPKSAQEILKLTESTDSKESALVEAVNIDPLMAVQVLKLANSTKYSRGSKKISEVSEAVSVLGYSVIKKSALEAFVCCFESQIGEKNDSYSDFFRHALCVAKVMEQLLAYTENVSTGHLIGLCHALPDLVLSQVFPEIYESAVREAREKNADFSVFVGRDLRVSYLDLATDIIREFGLPKKVEDAITRFYGKTSAFTLGSKRLADCLHLADSYAQAIGMQSPGSDSLKVFTKDFVLEAIGESYCNVDLDEKFFEEFERWDESLMASKAKESQNNKIDKKVLYWRVPELAINDQMELFLKLNVRDVKTVASIEDYPFDEFDALVVCGRPNQLVNSDLIRAITMQKAIAFCSLTFQADVDESLSSRGFELMNFPFSTAKILNVISGQSKS